MKNFSADIDIDTPNRDDILDIVQHIPSSIIKNGEVKKHNTGVYFQKMPMDVSNNGQSTLDYREAEDYGYIKIDFLNVSIYKEIQDEEHLTRLINKEPLWEMLEHKDIVSQLFHISDHFDIVQSIKPTSIEELAIVLALIRPSKRNLVGRPMDVIREEIWKKPLDGGYYFKKSHSISYAIAIVVQMNLMVEE